MIAKKDSVATGNHTFYESEADGAWDKADSNSVKIVVSSQEASYDSEVAAFVITAVQKNTPAIGKISIYAEGESWYLQSRMAVPFWTDWEKQ